MRAVWVIYPITTRQMNSLNTSATTAQQADCNEDRQAGVVAMSGG